MLHNGYEVCDTCDPYFELMVKNFDQRITMPSFKQSAKCGMGDGVRGIDIFYTEQCPFTVPYIKLLEPIMQASIYPVRCRRIETKEVAQNHFSPVTTYSLFVDGKFYTNEILTADKLNKLIEAVRG